MARFIWGACQASERDPESLKSYFPQLEKTLNRMKKVMDFGIHPKRCLLKRDGIFVDYYDVTTTMRKEWSRLEAVGEVCEEIFG